MNKELKRILLLQAGACLVILLLLLTAFALDMENHLVTSINELGNTINGWLEHA